MATSVTLEEVLNTVDLTNYMKKREIITQLHIKKSIDISEDKLRSLFRENNERYFNFESDIFIAHSSDSKNGGYKITTCHSEEYEMSQRDDISRLIELAKKIKRMNQRRSEEFNLKLILEEENLI